MKTKTPKLCKTCGVHERHPGRTECINCIYQKQREKALKKVQTPKKYKAIAKISKTKKERIKNEGSEKALFMAVWQSRADMRGQHWCEICGCEIKEPKSWCFSHNLSKGRYPEYRLYEKNITLVCSIACHKENDRKNVGRDQELIQALTSKK